LLKQLRKKFTFIRAGVFIGCVPHVIVAFALSFGVRKLVEEEEIMAENGARHVAVFLLILGPLIL